jgi:hypothetical protein
VHEEVEQDVATLAAEHSGSEDADDEEEHGFEDRRRDPRLESGPEGETDLEHIGRDQGTGQRYEERPSTETSDPRPHQEPEDRVEGSGQGGLLAHIGSRRLGHGFDRTACSLGPELSRDSATPTISTPIGRQLVTLSLREVSGRWEGEAQGRTRPSLSSTSPARAAD